LLAVFQLVLLSQVIYQSIAMHFMPFRRCISL